MALLREAGWDPSGGGRRAGDDEGGGDGSDERPVSDHPLARPSLNSSARLMRRRRRSRRVPSRRTSCRRSRRRRRRRRGASDAAPQHARVSQGPVRGTHATHADGVAPRHRVAPPARPPRGVACAARAGAHPGRAFHRRPRARAAGHRRRSRGGGPAPSPRAAAPPIGASARVARRRAATRSSVAPARRPAPPRVMRCHAAGATTQ